MKYYVYISDAKIDMLWPQVPHEVKKKVANEFKIDIKAFSASHKVEAESESDRIARLEAVVSFIEEFGNLGTVDEPDDYFRDVMDLRWGPYGSGADGPAVYFGGETDKTLLGLGGSSKHVIGNTGESHAHSHSATPSLLKFLEDQLVLEPSGKGQEPGSFLFTGEGWQVTAVELATTQMKGPKQSMEFFAKRLLYKAGEGSKLAVLLGTPLYVAMADASFEALAQDS